MNAKNVIVNGESLNVILRHYNAIDILIREVKRCNGSLYEWDKARGFEEFDDGIESVIEFKKLIL
jgi:hypothetical protein